MTRRVREGNDIGAWLSLACVNVEAFDYPVLVARGCSGALKILMRPVPMIDGVLAVDVTRHRDHRDEEEAMSGEKIA